MDSSTQHSAFSTQHSAKSKPFSHELERMNANQAQFQRIGVVGLAAPIYAQVLSIQRLTALPRGPKGQKLQKKASILRDL
jgi:hypothetical protein